MKKKIALITGINGQDGSYLAELLLEKGYEVHGIIRRSSTFSTERIDHIFDKCKLYYGDLSDSLSILSILKKSKPTEIYNLGAQSHVRVSFDIPVYTAEINALGTLKLLEAVRQFDPTISIYNASTSEMFGEVKEVPQTEDTPFSPRSPYGIAKVFAHWSCINYREAYNMFVCNGILFNHESPRRGNTFVTKKIIDGVKRIKNGDIFCLRLGNLDAQRDWGHAKDYVKAMWLMMQKDEPGDYVIATGVTTSIRHFLMMAFEEAGITLVSNGKRGIHEKFMTVGDNKIVVEIDNKYYRPTEVDLLLGNFSKADYELGWKPTITVRKLIRDMLEN